MRCTSASAAAGSWAAGSKRAWNSSTISRGHLRVSRQCLLDVAVAEGRPRLTQVAADRAQDRCVAPAQVGAQHQPVVAVALGLACPDPDEGLLEGVADGVGLRVVLARVAEAEVVEPDEVAVARSDRVGPLVGHLDAQVLEQRQDVGEGEGRAGAVDLRSQLPLRCLQRAVEAERQPGFLAGELLDAPDVGNRRPRHPIGAVCGREGFAIAAVERGAPLLSVLSVQRLLEIVAPRARRGHEQRLYLARVHVRQAARLGVDEIVQPHEHGLRDSRGVVEAVRAGRAPDDPLDASAVLGVEAVARHEHQTGQEAAEGVAAHEQAQALALAEVQDPDSDLEQLFDGDLEQLVARVGLQDLDQGLLVVAARRERGALEHGGHLAAQDRDVARAGVVGGVRVEAEEAPLADHLAVRVKALDTHVVEIGGPVHRGARVRLGHVEQVGLERAAAHCCRKLVESARALGALGLSQDAEPRAGHRDEAQVIGVGVLELVFAVAEEREVVVLEPGQELARLGHVAWVGDRWRAGLELLRELERALAHLGPVLHRRADLADHPAQVPLDLL